MKQIKRLIHEYMNALTSASGFLDLALGEPERSIRYQHMIRAQREMRRAIELAKKVREQIEAKASQYGED